ncbi:hypothetical protein AJ80_03931 [Polytolypa hystricis UAMH7299]|uniref:DNA (cytosine-5)-methyltransferase 1 replication foci domain-containing protein n=1 Tax=Polytolypa hystricis (strain UAMH7299) TaxID=1447883 RepID=A0A2B7YEF8_POLH7|nr:hypothetical protein AJ80_03931 [Polytolypa hystricis UAMH7299]
MTTRIEDVLRARDPSITDENDWEEFALTDVKVLVPGKARYANVLSASVDNPVSVTGQLEIVEEDQEHLVLDDAYRSRRVLIENVTHYAYGQHDDGEVGIWVAGEAGWFAINPARGYKPMFNEIVEAVDLLYFLADMHRQKGRRRKKWNPKTDYLFDEYTRHTHGACEDAEEAAEVFYKHHVFLIDEMVRGRESIDWSSTPLYTQLHELYPDDFKRSEEFVNAKKDEEEDPSDKDSDASTESHDGLELGKEQADTIFETILDMKESGMVSKSQLNIKSVAETLLKRYEMSDMDYALGLIKARARYILGMMGNAQPSNFDWSRRGIYKELKAAERAGGGQAYGATPLNPRALDSDSQPSSSPSAEESDDEIAISKGRRRRVRTSILRPKLSSVPAKRAGKSAKKAAGRRNREPEEDSSDSEQDLEESMFIDDTPSKPHGGHQLVHDALSTRINESTRSIFSDSDATSLRKTPMQETFDSITKPSSNHLDSENSPSVSAAIPSIPDDLPRDTWVCAVQDCEKIIYKASSKRSKEAILDHSLVHAEDTQTKLSLVMAEQRHNVNVTVSHLLSRIRDFGTMQEGETEEQDGAGPEEKRIKL